jgi:hypothetical protein
MRISIREANVMVERALGAAGAPHHGLLGAQRVILSAEIEHGAGVEHLARIVSMPGAADSTRFSLEAETGLDAAGVSAALAGPVALDLALAAASATGSGEVRVSGALGLEVLVGLAETFRRRGIAPRLTACDAAGEPLFAIEGGGLTGELPGGAVDGGFQLAVSADDVSAARARASRRSVWDSDRGFGWLSMADASDAERAAMREGLRVDDDAWAKVLKAAHRYLVPASAATRQHAGPPREVDRFEVRTQNLPDSVAYVSSEQTG